MTKSPKTAASKSSGESAPMDEAGLSDEEIIARAEADMERFAAERDACVARRKELMAAEDPAKGIFHATEIFHLQQDKLRLDVEMEFRRKKINRIRLGIRESSLMPPSRGPLF